MSIFQMSISATILILGIVVVRALAIHKLPKKTFLVLWGVVLLRLLIPFSIPSPLGTYTIIDKVAGVFTGATNPQTTNPNPIINVLPSIDTLDPFIAPTTLDGGTQISPVFVVWIVGMIACALFFLVTHLRCRREYKAALPIDSDYINDWSQNHKTRRSVQIRQSDGICAPLTYGLWKPVILLPKTTDWQDTTRLRYVLTHEMTHIKRFDILSKWLLSAALCVHWFNPLVWVMYILANRDIELSCDEKVVWTFGETMKSAYALALIGLEEKKSDFSPLCNHFAKNAIEERINAIMKIKRTTLVGILLAIFMVVGLTTAALALSANATIQADDAENTRITTNPVYRLCFAIDTELKDGYQDYDVYANKNAISFDTQEEMNEHLELLVKRIETGISGHALYEGFEDMYANIDLDAPMIGYIPLNGKFTVMANSRIKYIGWVTEDTYYGVFPDDEILQ